LSETARILVVDDVAANVKMLATVLEFNGYAVDTASGGREALRKLEAGTCDLVLLDVMMPDMSGYDVCRAIRADPETQMLPVVMVTALDPAAERVKGIEAGADDFLHKPVSQPELLARVKSLLRIKRLQDEVRRWNAELELRVNEQMAHLERLGRLKGFFAPQLLQSILSSGAEEFLTPHRREVTVMFLDLRGFTAFTESAEPEDATQLLREYHELVGPIAALHRGTVDSFAGDGMMILFNDPIELPNAVQHAVCVALEAHEGFRLLRDHWARRGYSIELGIGLSRGYATCGAFGVEWRRYYTAIGSVSNRAARLCGEAKPGQTLVDRETYASVASLFEAEPAGTLALKGFNAPVEAVNVHALKGT
jgi:adenylate cyclase